MFKNMFLALLIMALTGSAIAESERAMVVSVEPIHAVHGTFSAAFQYKLKDYMALTVPVSLGTNWLRTLSAQDFSAITPSTFKSSLFSYGAGIGARFFFKHNGLRDGFFAEPRIMLSVSKFKLTRDDKNMVDSNRITITPSLLAGYSWFFDNGFYVSTGIQVGLGYHVKNGVTVDEDLDIRLKDRPMVKNRLFADKSKLRFDYGYDVSLGFSW